LRFELSPLPRHEVSSLSLADARQALASSRGILLDWDGCVALGNRPIGAAVRLIAAHRDRVAIVSNNSTHLPAEFVATLAAAGVHLPPDRVILAGDEALRRATDIGAAKVLVLGEGRMKAQGRKLGLNLVQDDADLVVLLRDTRFSYAKLERAVNCLSKGARLIVANPDETHPGPQGRIVPETGSLLAAILACLDLGAFEMEVVGKPAPSLFRSACKVLGVAPEDAVMVGDNPATDIAGAEALGLRGILVGAHGSLSIADLI
jgi:4-nitrophenyl phosphatase